MSDIGAVCISCGDVRPCLHFACTAPDKRTSELNVCVACLRDPVQQRAITVALAEDAAAVVLVEPT